MELHKKLKQLRIHAKQSQIYVSEQLSNMGFNVKNYTVSKWESGALKPYASEFFALCDLYNVQDIRYTFTGVQSSGQYVSALDGLNFRGKEHARKYIGLLLDDPYYAHGDKITANWYRPVIIKLYDLPVSAGTGLYLDSEDYEGIEIDSTVPESTDFAVRISGDSMEPRFVDGQIVFIKKQSYLNNGEIGIFSLNGDAFCKKWGNGELISINPKYKPIKLNDYDKLHIFGKVIG